MKDGSVQCVEILSDSTNKMTDQAICLSAEQKATLLELYGNRSTQEGLLCGTVQDFCDSCDNIPFLAGIQGDLKDLQRPAALKAILGLCRPGDSVLEVGAGEPHVAHILTELGYIVTVVDPYDGSGRGPTEFEQYRSKYPKVRMVRANFSDQVSGIEVSGFECIYSISVLEHVHEPELSSVFAGIRRFLRPAGYSLHLIDHVLAGDGAQFHLEQLSEIVSHQAGLSGKTIAHAVASVIAVFNQAAADLDTYYLSAEGHNRWRGTLPYSSFPFRKVISIRSCERYTSDHSLISGHAPGEELDCSGHG